MLFKNTNYAEDVAMVNAGANQARIKQLGTQLNYLLELPNHETDSGIRKRIYEVGIELYEENMSAITKSKASFMAKVAMTADQLTFKRALEKMYGC